MKVIKNTRINLNEAFSPSMPKWLVGYFVKQIQRPHGSLKNTKVDAYAKAGIEIPTNAAEGGREWENIWRTIQNKGIDLNKAEFVSMPLPSKYDENTFSDSDKMYFIYFDINRDKYVWCPGYNDDEYFYKPTKDGGTARSSFKYMNNKLFNTYAVDICYLDLTNPKNQGLMASTRSQRATLQRSMDKSVERDREFVPEPNLARRMDKQAMRRNSIWDKRYKDASGYIVDPSRFDKKLKELRRSKLSDNFKKLYDKLIDLKSSINSVYISTDIDDGPTLTTLSKLIHDLSSTVNRYNTAANHLAEILQEPDERSRNYALDAFINSDFRGLDNNIAALENGVSQIAPYLVDWDDLPEEED